MIHSSTVSAALPVAISLDASSVRVVPVSGSLLAELTSLVHGTVADSVMKNFKETDQVIATLPELLQTITSDLQDHPSMHSVNSDNAIGIVAASVRRTIGMIQNEVVPVVSEFTDRVKDLVAKSSAVDAESSIEIKTFTLPEPLNNTGLLDEITGFKGLAIQPSTIILPTKTIEELESLLTTGDSELDSEIAEWAGRLPNTLLPDVYNRFFTREDLSHHSQVAFDLREIPLASRVDVSLMLYLISRNLRENPDAGLMNVTLTQYQDSLKTLVEYSQAILNASLIILNGYAKNDIMVVSIDSQKSATVFAPVYSKWLEEGGKPEIIMGLIVSGESFRTKAIINEKTGELLVAWGQFKNIHQSLLRMKTLNILKQSVEIAFYEGLKDLTSIEKQYGREVSGYKETVLKYFKEAVGHLKVKDIDHLEHECMEIITRSRFYFTDAEMVLSYMEQAAAINPSIQPSEAALLAVIEYVADYLADQMTVAFK